MDVCDFKQTTRAIVHNHYKIEYSRLTENSCILVGTVGLVDAGMLEVFAICRSRRIDDATLLLNTLVRRMLETDQRIGIRKDLICHPETQLPIRYLVKRSPTEPTVIAVGPDINNRLPGEKGFIKYL